MSAAMLLSTLLAASTLQLAAAEVKIKVDPAITYPGWEGWGTSLAWWAAVFGDRDDLADAFFSLKETKLNDQTIPGLGFTIARYNAGACTKNQVNNVGINITTNMIPSRAMEGFWLNDESADINSASWDWEVDKNQRLMLSKAVERGVTHTELFSNAPMWWMLENLNPAGGNDGGNNLLPEYFAKHADYMAAVAEKAARDWGVTFTTIEPFNEPMANWWKGPTGTQEGCHIDRDSQAKIIGHLAEAMKKRSITKSTIAASDENHFQETVDTWKAIGPTAQGQITRINAHGYQAAQNDARKELWKIASEAKKDLWTSEHGENDATGSRMVNSIMLDLRLMHPNGWVYWQVLDGGGWGLIDADNEAKTIKGATTKYYALAHFSRHIRPGMTLLETGSDSVVAAYDASTKKLAIVAANFGETDTFSFDISSFKNVPAAGTVVPAWETILADTGARYASNTKNTISGTQFGASLEKNSVQTFEIEGLTL
ncbi:hypothetical protein Cpir12675_004581 [Ceratocystis pirilliformis]|uniref:Endo-beta-1,6-galactanase-like domain-containing protein n=1 Tax=Ceratocystis pirilliformis TaxID=259994 RepID=A0ABR3YW55_9PEZI